MQFFNQPFEFELREFRISCILNYAFHDYFIYWNNIELDLTNKILTENLIM